MNSIPKGFKISTASAGFRKADRTDLGLIVSEFPAKVAGTFTTNAFKAAPVRVCMETLANEIPCMAIVVNSGQANACTGDAGLKLCHDTLKLTADATNLNANTILPLSTGVIGDQISLDLWQKAMPELTKNLGTKNIEDFTRAMMTTDAFPKFYAAELDFNGKTIRLAGMAKGAGMICPNMATMLSVILCDAEISTQNWQKMFSTAVENTFNRVSVDGDTSTNDTVLGLANGASNIKIESEADLKKLHIALEDILSRLAYMLVQDGEGATKVIKISVTGAASNQDAELAARTIGHSQLVKTAMYGKDANWGRIVAALGRSKATFNPKDVTITLCGIELFRNEQPTQKNADDLLTAPLNNRDIHIEITLGQGQGQYTLLASDLTHDYVTCNAAYRT